MAIAPYILAIDQGTTSSRAILFRRDVSIAAVAQQEFPQHFPAPGWVEHDPEEIWRVTLGVCEGALRAARVEARELCAVGLTNQRETVVAWERASGEPVARAVVWQDRRTAPDCDALRARGLERTFRE